MTPGAERLLQREEISALALIERHAFGDWGDIAREDRGLNDESLKDGSRLLSVYKLPNTGETIWLITEAADDDGHRHATTALLPDEY